MLFNKQLAINLLLACVFAVHINAAPRTKSDMRTIAMQVLNQSSSARRLFKADKPKTIESNNAFTIMGYEKGGFAIIANDDLLPAVIGYSFSDYSGKSRNENFKWYLKSAEEAINYMVTNGIRYKILKPDTTKFEESMGPLVTAHWGQESPYNDLCPYGTTSGRGEWQGYGSTGRTVTGCVATAMAQIMYYNKYPKHGIGTHSVNVKQADGSRETVTVNYEESTYKWDDMIDNYEAGKYTTAQGEAVAKLMLDCGVAADMMYATDGSGTYTYNACEGLKRNFGYPSTTQYVERDQYSEAEWMDMVFTEINARRAILYTGVDTNNGGHAFVLCGYDKEGKVWINWGWDGEADGYYNIALLNPMGYRFSKYQDMIIGFKGEIGELVKDTVVVKTPGTLGTLIPDSITDRISELKVEGSINSTDLKLLRKIAGRDSLGQAVRSSLLLLDMSDATIVEGGEPYLIEGKRKLTTSNNEMPEKAFYNCQCLNKLYLPKSITKIGDGAFGRIIGLNHVNIPLGKDKDYVVVDNVVYSKDTVELIAAMPRISGKIKLKQKVKRIHHYGLSGCSRMEEIVIPQNIEYIGDEAFAANYSLQAIRIYAKSIPELGRNVFEDINKKRTKLYVPAGMKNKYNQASQWKTFNEGKASNIVEFGTTIKARNDIRKYGENNPVFGWQVKGDYVNGTPILSCNADKASPVGKYVIHVERGSITEEEVEFEDGYLIVQKATANLRANDLAIKVNETPEFTYTVDSLQNNETEIKLTESPVFTVMNASGETLTEFTQTGTYRIVVSGGVSDNYQFNYVPAKLTVMPGTSGIDNLSSSGKEGVFDIYTVTGTLIVKNAKSASNLPKGIYIINNRKVIVK
ncbi:MAG: C10 family peptidase [Prevotellaceae bacterium]|nr:C10 family peptidase [Prevotellaceae bacterium]